jgi:hypothetical protein
MKYYAGSFVVVLPNINIMYPSLVHSLCYSPSSSTPLLEMISAGFSVAYSYMNRKYLNHFHPPLSSSFTLPLLLLSTP